MPRNTSRRLMLPVHKSLGYNMFYASHCNDTGIPTITLSPYTPHTPFSSHMKEKGNGKRIQQINKAQMDRMRVDDLTKEFPTLMILL